MSSRARRGARVAGALLPVFLAVAGTAGGSRQPVPTPIGIAAGYRLPPHGAAVTAARPVGRLACSARARPRFGVHLELFARRLVLIVPAGIGIAPPLVRRDRAFVLAGRCSYDLRTREPTGVIEVARGSRLLLGSLFDLWGQPLSRTRVAGFRSRRGEQVLAFVGGRRWHGDPRSIPLRRHAQIVLEIGGYVPPHVAYRFPQGL